MKYDKSPSFIIKEIISGIVSYLKVEIKKLDAEPSVSEEAGNAVITNSVEAQEGLTEVEESKHEHGPECDHDHHQSAPDLGEELNKLQAAFKDTGMISKKPKDVTPTGSLASFQNAQMSLALFDAMKHSEHLSVLDNSNMALEFTFDSSPYISVNQITDNPTTITSNFEIRSITVCNIIFYENTVNIVFPYDESKLYRIFFSNEVSMNDIAFYTIKAIKYFAPANALLRSFNKKKFIKEDMMQYNTIIDINAANGNFIM